MSNVSYQECSDLYRLRQLTSGTALIHIDSANPEVIPEDSIAPFRIADDTPGIV
jgi:hypothetical protein